MQMKRRLDKTLKRLKKEKTISKIDDFEPNKLNPYEIKVFRSLRDKYNLSINETLINSDEKKIDKKIQKTLERIKKGEEFKP
tara:strand:- start:78 stop:323 length:246 start_codon:yes stop_codon:yes gene_type:complete